MSATPPQRLTILAEPSSALAQGLAAARVRGPSEDELRALERELAAALGGAALLGAAAGAATAKSGGVAAGAAQAWLSTAAMKVTTVIVLAAVGTAGGVAWRRHASRGEGRTDLAAGAHDSPAPAPSTIALLPTPKGPEALAPAPSPMLSPVSPRLGDAGTSPSRRRAGPLRSRHAANAGSAMGARPLVLDPPPGDGASLPDELRLIDHAQQVLSEDPGRALALAEEHGRRYGDALLAQEREVIAVAALSKLGRTVEARARAERFIRRFPESAHLARIRRLAVAGRTP